jgi:hypothetical protein
MRAPVDCGIQMIHDRDGYICGPAFKATIADALTTAERIMKRIDERFPASTSVHRV